MGYVFGVDDQPGAAFGALLRVAREYAKLSQQQLAERVGVERKTVSRWENGHTQSLGPNALKLAAVFGWSADELTKVLSGDGTVFAPTVAYSIDTATGMKITPSGKEFPPVMDDLLHLLTDEHSPLDADERRHLEEHLRHLVLMTMSMARRVRAALESESPNVLVAQSDSGKSAVIAHVTEVPDQHPDPAPVSVRRP